MKRIVEVRENEVAWAGFAAVSMAVSYVVVAWPHIPARLDYWRTDELLDYLE